MHVISLDVELSQVFYASNRTRDSSCQPVASDDQPLETLTVYYQSVGNAPFQIVIVQVQVSELPDRVCTRGGKRFVFDLVLVGVLAEEFTKCLEASIRNGLISSLLLMGSIHDGICRHCSA